MQLEEAVSVSDPQKDDYFCCITNNVRRVNETPSYIRCNTFSDGSNDSVVTYEMAVINPQKYLSLTTCEDWSNQHDIIQDKENG